jgi:hypothetical protein
MNSFAGKKGSNEALMGREVVSGIWRVASYHCRSGWGRLRWRKALKLGGILIGSGGCLCCDSLERSDLSFIGSGKESKRRVGKVNRTGSSRS